MGKKISLIVNYRNALGLFHLAVEQMTVSAKNYFVRPEDFAKFVAETYMSKGCDHVICVEFLQDRITKSELTNLAECDIQFLTEMVKDKIGQRWEFEQEKGDQKK